MSYRIKKYKKPLAAQQIVGHAHVGQPFEDPFRIGYLTRGGTYVIASNPKWNDDSLPHDLVAITRYGGVHPLSITVDEDWINLLKQVIRRDEEERPEA